MIKHLASSVFSKALYSIVVSAYFFVSFSSCQKKSDIQSSNIAGGPSSQIKSVKPGSGNSLLGAKTSPYTGEDLFKAIAFNIGPAANMVASLSHSIYKDTTQSSLVLTTKVAFATELISKIKLINPLYFDTLKTDIISDDYFKIESALGKMGDIALQGALLTSYGNYIQTGLNIASQINVNDYNLKTDEGLEAYRNAVQNIIQQNQSQFPAGVDCIIAAVVFIAAALILVITHAAVAAQGLVFVLVHSIVAAKVRVKISIQRAANSKYSTENLITEIANAF